MQEPWPSVGCAVAADRPSTVFVMQPVYRELLQWYRRLQDTWEVTLNSPAFTIPLRSLPELYERWCFAKVVAALQKGLGHPGYDRGLIRYREGGFEFALERGGSSEILFRAVGRRVGVYYQKLYRSFTELNYVPDISLEVEGPGGPAGLVVLDAKYRRVGEEEGTRFRHDGPVSFRIKRPRQRRGLLYATFQSATAASSRAKTSRSRSVAMTPMAKIPCSTPAELPIWPFMARA